MTNKTKYEIIVDFLLDYWIIAAIILIAVIIGFIPNLRDGVIEIWSWRKRKKRHEEFKIIKGGETITFELRTSSMFFDVVKINCITHHIGVDAEYQWVEKYYPDFKVFQQALTIIDIDETEKKHYDVLDMRDSKGKEKSIYFDISSFFNESGHSSYNRDEFIESKIRELHRK